MPPAQPLELEHTADRVAITRPAPLAKGQQKFLELMFFVPRDRTKAWLSTELRSRGGGVAATPGAEPLSMLKAHQYHLVVLANTPDRYKRLETLDSVKAPHIERQLGFRVELAVLHRRHAATYQTVTAAHQRTGLVEHRLFGLGRR